MPIGGFARILGLLFGFAERLVVSVLPCVNSGHLCYPIGWHQLLIAPAALMQDEQTDLSEALGSEVQTESARAMPHRIVLPLP